MRRRTNSVAVNRLAIIEIVRPLAISRNWRGPNSGNVSVGLAKIANGIPSFPSLAYEIKQSTVTGVGASALPAANALSQLTVGILSKAEVEVRAKMGTSHRPAAMR
jgi:hypothetical protein